MNPAVALSRLFSPGVSNCRLYCSSFDRNRKYYQLTMDGDKSTERPSPVADLQRNLEQSKEKLKWRKPVAQYLSFFSFGLGMFKPAADKSARLQEIAKSDQWSFDYFRRVQSRKKRNHEILAQSFIPERHRILGNDLAAAHFIVARGGKVRFTRSDEWVVADSDGNFNLPPQHDPQYLVDAIICDNMTLYYEGLENIRRLNELRFLSLQNVKEFDDWGLDRLGGNELNRLEVLDISGTKVTTNGICALLKFPSLRLLILSDASRSVEFELSLVMVQDLMPNLVVRDIADIAEETKLTNPAK